MLLIYLFILSVLCNKQTYKVVRSIILQVVLFSTPPYKMDFFQKKSPRSLSNFQSIPFFLLRVSRIKIGHVYKSLLSLQPEFSSIGTKIVQEILIGLYFLNWQHNISCRSFQNHLYSLFPLYRSYQVNFNFVVLLS